MESDLWRWSSTVGDGVSDDILRAVERMIGEPEDFPAWETFMRNMGMEDIEICVWDVVDKLVGKSWMAGD